MFRPSGWKPLLYIITVYSGATFSVGGYKQEEDRMRYII